MSYFVRPALIAGALGSLAAACDQAEPASTPETGVSVTVAPLDLPGMTDACYSLTVFNVTNPASFDETTQVWTQPELCASQYGADGGIRFTGICDAQAAGETHDNAIRLVLNDVYTGGDVTTGTALTAGRDYVNPCPRAFPWQPDNGCVLTAPCTENQDSKIVFNLTVMRNASLGFFDTVVKFQDLFCAAKTDCVEDDGTTTLTYLHDDTATPPADGPTAVVGFACTGGADAADTFMYLSQLTVTCTNSNGDVTRTATIDPSGGPGNVDATESDALRPILFGAAVNRGDGNQQGTAYWNVLLGMKLNGDADETCSLTASGTASDTALAFGATPDHTRYPIVEWDVDLSTGTDRICTRHPLNGGNGVGTTYTAIDAARTFPYQLTRGDDVVTSTTPAPRVLLSGASLPEAQGWAERFINGPPDALSSDGTDLDFDTTGPSFYGASGPYFDSWSQFSLPLDKNLLRFLDLEVTLQVITAGVNGNPGFNPYDAGISFQPGGEGSRGDMVYFSEGQIGWADDGFTSSGHFDLDTTSAMVTYRFSRGADGVDRVYANGALALSRPAAASAADWNGNIVFGDQSNDDNVEGHFRLRSIALVAK